MALLAAEALLPKRVMSAAAVNDPVFPKLRGPHRRGMMALQWSMRVDASG